MVLVAKSGENLPSPPTAAFLLKFPTFLIIKWKTLQHKERLLKGQQNQKKGLKGGKRMAGWERKRKTKNKRGDTGFKAN